MWLLEGTPKKKAPDGAAATTRSMGPAAPEVAKIKIDIGVKDLMCHRYRAYDKADKEMMDTQFTNMKPNATPDAALFKYTPPAGARVMDMTKGMPDMSEMMKSMPKGAMPKTMPNGVPDGE
jgi:outer membrane lipoprotein-sorting protein